MSQLTLIVAATTKNGIGRGATMPWHIPKDLAYFSRVTTSAPTAQANVVLMGRKTWESIPNKFRPLKKRINIVLSRNKDYDLFTEGKTTHSPADSTYLCSELKDALETLKSHTNIHRIFVIGGSTLYQEALALGSPHPNYPSLQADRILLTRIYSPEFECDVFFPDVLDGADWTRTSHEDLCAWAGSEVPAGVQTESGVQFEFQMWVRQGGVGQVGGNP